MPADVGRGRGAGRAAGALGGALVAVGRGRRRRWPAGSTSPAPRICSAARRGWCAMSSERFAGLGLTARVAIAPTAGRGVGAGAASLRERQREMLRSLGRRPASDRSRPLPVAALRLPPEPTQTLERLGLKTIGALAGVPRRVAGAAVSRGRQSARCARPDAGAEARALVGDPGRAAAASDVPAGRAGRRSGGDGTGAGADGRALVRRAGAAAAGRAASWRSWPIGSTARSARPRPRPRCRRAIRRICVRLLSERVATLDPGFGFDGFALVGRAGASRWTRRRTRWSASRRASCKWRG